MLPLAGCKTVHEWATNARMGVALACAVVGVEYLATSGYKQGCAVVTSARRLFPYHKCSLVAL